MNHETAMVYGNNIINQAMIMKDANVNSNTSTNNIENNFAGLAYIMLCPQIIISKYNQTYHTSPSVVTS